MIQVDKIMKANELNFQLFALLPVVAFLYGTYYFVTKERQNRVAMTRLRALFQETHILLNSNLTHAALSPLRISGDHGRKAERGVGVNYFVENQLAPIEYGRLIISLSRLRSLSCALTDKRDWFDRDLHEIEKETYTVQQRLNTMDRMYRSYKFLSV